MAWGLVVIDGRSRAPRLATAVLAGDNSTAA